MDTNPLFSILTATRNGAKYIKECIESVIKQDYKSWEMIICDDASKDDTYNIIIDVAKNHENIKVLHNIEQLRCGMNYNRILSMATGKYCGVLDGDDKLATNAISTIVKAYESNPKIDFIWTQHYWCNDSMTKCKMGISKQAMRGTIYNSEGDSLRQHVYSHWRTFKTDMKRYGTLFRDLPCAVDKDLGYSLEEIGKGAFLNKPLYFYRYHKTNMSRTKSTILLQKVTWKNVRIYHKHRHRHKSTVLS